MMLVSDLIKALQAMPQDALVEFHDATYNRTCPVNIVHPQPVKVDRISAEFAVVLTNNDGRYR
jgi:hypothetical protein